jgi:hypothetical protein
LKIRIITLAALKIISKGLFSQLIEIFGENILTTKKKMKKKK